MKELRTSIETGVDGCCCSLFINRVSKKSFDQSTHVIFVSDLYEFKISYYLYAAI